MKSYITIALLSHLNITFEEFWSFLHESIECEKIKCIQNWMTNIMMKFNMKRLDEKDTAAAMLD